jgi:RNA polymerase sigma factor (sigma-70 family)
MTMAGTDAEVMHAAVASPAAFGELFERHFDAVHRFCQRRVGWQSAEDLTGETFRRAFEARASYDLDQPDALPWLYRIALNLIRDQSRTLQARDRAYGRLGALASVGGWVADAVATIEAREDLAAVAAVLAASSPQDVEALFLHLWDDLSYREVAVALGVPVGTIHSRMSRLRDRLDAVRRPADCDPEPTRITTGGA